MSLIISANKNYNEQILTHWLWKTYGLQRRQFGGWGDGLRVWNGRDIKLGCDVRCTTINVIKFIELKKKTVMRSFVILNLSWLRTWHCYCCGVGSVPGHGTSACCSYDQKNKKQKPVRYYLIPSRMATINKIASVNKDLMTLEHLCTIVGNVKLYSHCGKQYASSSTN